MIPDWQGRPRYYDKPFEAHAQPPSPELKALYLEMEMNPRFHLDRNVSFYPRGYPTQSPGWSVG
jgi:hypothetical protein